MPMNVIIFGLVDTSESFHVLLQQELKLVMSKLIV